MQALAQTAFTWEAKVFVSADAVETNWKHKINPDCGDLKTLKVKQAHGR